MISASSASGSVSGSGGSGGPEGTDGTAYVGGLVGENATTVAASYATGNVSGSADVGGLVGYNAGTVSASYATGNVTGSSNVGGLVGENAGSVVNTYATGVVTGTSPGALVGLNDATGVIDTSYALPSSAPNLVGINNNVPGTTDSYLTSLTLKSGYNGFSFAQVTSGAPWYIVEGYTTPLLTAFAAPNGTVTNAYQLELVGDNPSGSGTYTLGATIDLSLAKLGNAQGGVWSAGNGFGPIGNASSPFTGSFNGNSGSGYTISNLTINAPSGANSYVGLFGTAAGAASATWR